MYRIIYEKQAAEDIKKLKGIGLDEKAKNLVEVIRQNPFAEKPSYESLKGCLDGYYSRRINIIHRMVYQVHEKPFSQNGMEYEGTVKIIRMWSRQDK